MKKRLLGLLLIGLLGLSSFASTAQIDTSGVGNTALTTLLIGPPSANLSTVFKDVSLSGRKTYTNTATIWSSGSTLFGSNTMFFTLASLVDTAAASTWTYLHDHSTDLTIQFWMNMTVANNNGGAIISTSVGTGDSVGLLIDTYGTGTIIRVTDGGFGVSSKGSWTATVSDYRNAWHHVAVEYNKTLNKWILFYDGVLQFSNSPSGTNAGAPANPLWIGNSNLSSTSFTGYLSNVKIDKALLYRTNFIPPKRGS